HDDLDLVVELKDTPLVRALLDKRGYERVVGAPPTSFVHVDPDGRQVDVHPVVFDAVGDGLYEMEEGGTWAYPAQGFAGRGHVLGTPVRCLSPEVQVLVHDDYELADKDFLELRLLHERFGVA